MSLINCPECRKEVSNKAEQCPNCGYPIQKKIEGMRQNAMEEYKKINIEKNEKSAKKVAKKLYYVLLLNNIPCDIFPETEEWKLIKCWIKENMASCKKVTLDNVIKVSKAANVASDDYSEYKKFIEHYDELFGLREEIRIKSETETKIREENYQRELEETEKKVNKLLHPTQVSTNMPKCPNCGSIKIENIGAMNRTFSVAMWGLASSKIGKTKQCKSCGYEW